MGVFTALLLILFALAGSGIRAKAQQRPPEKSATPSQSNGKVSPPVGPGANSDEDLPCPQDRNQTSEARFKDYEIRTYRWPEPEGCLQIFKRGRVVYSLESADFKIGGNFESGVSVPIGTDITGTGTPDAIVGEWSGGAHCCYTLHVFELGEKLRQIGQIKAEDSDEADFRDLNHDGTLEFVGYDWAFAYWNTSFLYSPAPRIVLKYRQGCFRLALDMMKDPRPTAAEFAALVRRVRADREWSSDQPTEVCDKECGVPVPLWKNMLHLMYTGHADLAWRLFDESWPDRQKGKGKFAAAFCKQLSSSRYWSDLKPAIGACPPQ